MTECILFIAKIRNYVVCYLSSCLNKEIFDAFTSSHISIYAPSDQAIHCRSDQAIHCRHMYIAPDGVVDVKCALEDDRKAGSADVSLTPV